MGLLNITHQEMTQALIDMEPDLVKNPYYLFSDKKPSPVEYYNINAQKSTLDEALKIQYEDYGPNCSLRFNIVHGMYLYGIDRIAVSLENGEFGLESGKITGEFIVLPNTIHPYPGDFFKLKTKTTNKSYLFRVNEINTDTFDNGANYWKGSYELWAHDSSNIDELVVEEYNFITGNIGTSQYSSVIKSTKYDVCKMFDDAAVALKLHYRALYYNNKVQTFTFVYLYHVCQTNMNSDFFYDPYMMEFIIKNKVLSNTGEKYDYIDHKTTLSSEFPIKYDRSIWKIIENCDKDNIMSCKSSSAAAYIDDPSTIFSTRYENYFELTYDSPNPVLEAFSSRLSILDPQVLGAIVENKLFDYNSPFAKYNIIIKYFNHRDAGIEDIVPLEKIDESSNNMENYFVIPMIIYIMEIYIKKLMVNIEEL